MDVFVYADLPQLQKNSSGNSSKETEHNGNAFSFFISHGKLCVCVLSDLKVTWKWSGKMERFANERFIIL